MSERVKERLTVFLNGVEEKIARLRVNRQRTLDSSFILNRLSTPVLHKEHLSHKVWCVRSSMAPNHRQVTAVRATVGVYTRKQERHQTHIEVTVNLKQDSSKWSTLSFKTNTVCSETSNTAAREETSEPLVCEEFKDPDDPSSTHTMQRRERRRWKHYSWNTEDGRHDPTSPSNWTALKPRRLPGRAVGARPLGTEGPLVPRVCHGHALRTSRG